MNGQERLNYVPEENVSTTRNSPLRRIAQIPAEFTVKALHEAVPWIKADHITAAGVWGVAVGSAIAISGERPKIALSVLTASSTLDGLDGPMARLIAKENPKKKNPYGGLVDTVADRVQEATLGISRAVGAQKRGDRVGEALAIVSTISNGLPSVMRAIAESRGIAVSESGGNFVGFLGTRTGRTITGILSTVFPEAKGLPVQKILDTLNIVANTFTAVSRFRKAFISNKVEKPLKPQAIEEAEERAIILTGTLAATTMAVGATYVLGKNK